MPVHIGEQEESAISRNKCGAAQQHAPRAQHIQSNNSFCAMRVCVRDHNNTHALITDAWAILETRRAVNSTLRRFLSQYRRLSVTRRAQDLWPRGARVRPDRVHARRLLRQFGLNCRRRAAHGAPRRPQPRANLA